MPPAMSASVGTIGRLQERPFLARDRPQPATGERLVAVERPGERVRVDVCEPEDEHGHLDDPERLPDRVARVGRRDDGGNENRPVDGAGEVLAPVQMPKPESHYTLVSAVTRPLLTPSSSAS